MRMRAYARVWSATRVECVNLCSDGRRLLPLSPFSAFFFFFLVQHRALNYLKTWMQNNPDYSGAAFSQQKQELNQYMQFYGGENASSPYTYDNLLHDEVTKMFLNALTIRPDDPDLHTVLGVLYHISSDFDKAIDAFKNAVKLKPDDAALWNKLGATQANSSRSGDAVHAYKRSERKRNEGGANSHRYNRDLSPHLLFLCIFLFVSLLCSALQLRPAFVRALANLAISYANQGLHEDAIRTYLTTLSHNPEASHVWSYLRISLSHMQRDELVELSHVRINTHTPLAMEVMTLAAIDRATHIDSLRSCVPHVSRCCMS